MDSELQRLRFRVRQLEREVRALRSAARKDEIAPAAPAARMPAPLFVRRRVLRAPAGDLRPGRDE